MRTPSHATRSSAGFRLAAALMIVVAATAGAQTPAAAVNELLAADRAFSAAAANVELIAGLSAMFTGDVIMPLPQGKFARDREAAVAALQANPAHAGAKVEWAPVRGGVSADGLHGFTFGLMTVRRGTGPVEHAKYLAYWVKSPVGWRVAAYKRAPRAEGEVRRESMPPSLPDRLVEAVRDQTIVAAHRQSLIAAERSFSDLSQRIGLGPAFRANGRSDAMNMGGGAADFVYGNEAIAESVSAGFPPNASPFTWAADDALVASSGDLGVTFGIIHQNDAPAAPGFAFFTIWRRESPQAPWKYIAE